MKTLSIPPAEKSIYHALPQAARDQLDRELPVIAALIAGGKKGITRRIAQAAPLAGLSPQRLRAKYDEALKAGTWRVLINKARLSTSFRRVPSEFIPWWHGLVLENQRCTRKAHQKFCRLYAAGEPIPGLPPAAERSRALPGGLRERNLARYVPTDAQLALARQGVAAAITHLPHVLQDVGGVRPLEYLLFDDVELDFLCQVPEAQAPVKIRLIVAMDLCSRVILGYGFRPAITRPDGVEDGLKLRDMKMVVARVLRTWGVPVAFPMHLICERGTAAIPNADKTALAEISNGQIVVHDTSMIVGQVFAFRDKSTGKSWGKAWLESFFNPLHGELADLPGQKGRRWDVMPAEHEGRRRELAALVRAGKRLPLDARLALRMPFMDAAEAMQALDDALARLHTSTPRELQGFEKIQLWALPGSEDFKPVAALPEILMDKMDALIWTARQEFPMERFQRLIVDVERMEIAACSLARLMDEHVAVRFQDYQFSFTYKKTDYTYLPPEQMLPLLAEKTDYLLWFHPQDMATVYVTRARPHLGYVGVLTQFERVRKGDLEAAKLALKETHARFAHALTRTQDPAIRKLQRRAEDLAFNAAQIEEATANARALEVEVDVVAPSTLTHDAPAPASVVAMSEDIARRASDRATAPQRQRDAAAAQRARFAREAEDSARLRALAED